MRMTRVYVESALHPGGTVELARETAAHLAKVLRARSGDELVLFNGDGREFGGVIEAVRGSKVSASIGAAHRVQRESPLGITLVQCVPRGDRMDLIVQKATELGVARIVPVLSQRSVVRLADAQVAAKQLHWRAVAIGACEQSGRTRLPVIEAPQPLLRFLGNLPAAQAAALRWVLEPETLSPEPAPGLAPASLQEAGSQPLAVTDAQIAVGPEGGFTPEELEALQLCGFVAQRLGPRILRTETAAIAAVVTLQTRFGDM